MTRFRIADLEQKCNLCPGRGDWHVGNTNVATRCWFGDTAGEYTKPDYVEGVLCCTTCYHRVYRRARRRMASV